MSDDPHYPPQYRSMTTKPCGKFRAGTRCDSKCKHIKYVDRKSKSGYYIYTSIQCDVPSMENRVGWNRCPYCGCGGKVKKIIRNDCNCHCHFKTAEQIYKIYNNILAGTGRVIVRISELREKGVEIEGFYGLIKRKAELEKEGLIVHFTQPMSKEKGGCRIGDKYYHYFQMAYEKKG